MFTGIISTIGTITDLKPSADSITWLKIQTSWDCDKIAIGASVACNGICLTVIERHKNSLAFEASHETSAITTLSGWKKGGQVNLETAVRVGDELGGHIVSGHVDGLATVTGLTQDGDSHEMEFEVASSLAPLIAAKGSVSLDGVSLTVNKVLGNRFSIMVIPHTCKHTTLSLAAVGDKVNIEVDMLARYAARILSFGNQST